MGFIDLAALNQIVKGNELLNFFMQDGGLVVGDMFYPGFDINHRLCDDFFCMNIIPADHGAVGWQGYHVSLVCGCGSFWL